MSKHYSEFQKDLFDIYYTLDFENHLEKRIRKRSCNLRNRPLKGYNEEIPIIMLLGGRYKAPKRAVVGRTVGHQRNVKLAPVRRIRIELRKLLMLS